MSDETTENTPQTPDVPDDTTSSPATDDTLKKALAEMQEENKRILSEMSAMRKLYEQSFNRQPAPSPEHDEFDEVCQKILKGER